MDIQISEGRLVEFPSPDATGVDRRAFGQFIGPEGERGSYALGWTTRGDHGSLSVGFGAGSPGGATMHAIVFNDGVGVATALTDEPFESFADGGPHLTAAQASAHKDLLSMLSVASHVLLHDRRAWWMKHWLLHTRCFQTPQVSDLSEAVLLVHNDDDDEYWQLIGLTDPGDDGNVSHISHAVDDDPTLMDVLDLAPGEFATRQHRGGPWTWDPARPSLG